MTTPDGAQTSADGSQVPVQATSGYTFDTTEEAPSNQPDFMKGGAPISNPGDALRNPYAAELNKLNTFLMQAFPQEMQRTNRMGNESPADTAIRLLQAKGAGPGAQRCAAEYCNLPRNHDGPHGFVNFSQT